MTQTELLSALETAGFTLCGDYISQGTWGDGSWVERWQWVYKTDGNCMQHQWIKFITKVDQSQAFFLGSYDPTATPGTEAIRDWMNAKISGDEIEGYIIHDLDPGNETAIVTVYEVSGGKVSETRYFVDRDVSEDLQMREIE